MSKNIIAGAILPELNERTLSIGGTALRLYDNDGNIRTDAVLGARALLKSRIKSLTRVAKDLDKKILEDLQAGVEALVQNHTLELGEKTKTSTKWKPFAAELMGVDLKEIEAAVKDTEHYTSGMVPALMIDGKLNG